MNGDSQPTVCEVFRDRFSRRSRSPIDRGVSVMVDAPGQLKRFGRRHAGNMPAKQVDDLLIRVTIAIVDDDFSFQVAAAAETGFLFRDFRHFCRGKGTHMAFCRIIVPMGS